MKNLKKRIQSHLDAGYNPNLDSLDTDDLNEIENYLKEINNSGYKHRISKIQRDEKKLEIEFKTSIAYLRKKK